MVPYAVAVLLSIATFFLGFEAGKYVGYEQAKSIMVTMIATIMQINAKEKEE